MTTLTLLRSARQAPRLHALGRAISNFFTGIQDGLAMAEEYKQLSRLTDGELAQRGITRADIPRVVARGLLGACVSEGQPAPKQPPPWIF
jgi:uncharacterized protein YjiS (DUF1127 family)